MRKVKYFVLVMFAMLALSGCGGGSDSSPATTTISLSGTAVDGYISGATAFLDINANGRGESPEPSAVTDANGTFSFTDVEVAKDKLLTVIVSGGIDTATNKPFVGELKSIVESATITAQTPLSVTPLTDLIATLFLQSATKDTQALNNAKAEIAQVFSLSQKDVTVDPMTNVAVFAKVQEVQQIKALLEVAVAKAATIEMTETQLSQLRNDITLSLVTQIKESSTSTLDVSEVLIEIARVSSVTIPQNEITFIAAQVTEIKKSLDALAADTTVDVTNLDEFQAGLEKEQETALERLKVSTPEEDIVVVPAGDTNALIESGGQVPGELTAEELAAAQAAADAAAAAAAAVTPTLAASTGTIEENASAGTAVGNITISNAGGTPITAITLSGTGSTDFEVSTLGAITVKAGAVIDFETRPSYALTAVATNTGGASSSVTVTITVANIVETVPSLAPFTGSIAEDATIGSVVGTITATAEGSSITAFTLSDTTNFAVSAAGEITTTTTLDFETTSSYALTVYATNTLGSSSSVSVTISVARVAESAPAADQNSAGELEVPPAPPAL